MRTSNVKPTMKKLEDIPKNNIFEVPEGYFDKLPGVIQSRVAAKEKQSTIGVYGLALKVALPLLTIGLAVFLIFRENDPHGSPEDLLASVSTEQLSDYLIDTDLSTDELLDNLDLNELDVNALNEEILYEEFDNDLLEEYVDGLELEL